MPSSFAPVSNRRGAAASQHVGPGCETRVYFRKLLRAEVPAVSRTVNGTCHAGDCLFVGAMPDVVAATIRDIESFADSV
jgi:hypothetical protein